MSAPLLRETTTASHRPGLGGIKISAAPPFSCICTPRYDDDRYLLNWPDSRLF